MKRRTLCLAALAAASIGCTASGRWGNEARYAPDFRGYVIARTPASAPRILLKNPLTGEKIRCRERLEPYLVPITREAATWVHDEGIALKATAPMSLPLLPAAGSGMLFMMGGAILKGPPEGLAWLLSSPSDGALYDRGKRALDAGRSSEAERLFERALAKRGGGVDAQRSSYFLGVLYERGGRPRDAVRAYRWFVERADVRDEAAYDDAERRLAALDPDAIAPCRSQTPLTFAWPAPR